MHRNAEIWEKRHERIQTLRTAHHRHIMMAYTGATSSNERSRIADAQRHWLSRWNVLSQRVWNALCVAKGWRKA